MKGYIDLHCHVLPALDDGPQDVETAAQTVRALEALGFAEFYPTPHQKANAWSPDPTRCSRASRSLLAELGASASTIHAAAGENMWDELFLARQADRSFPHYPGGKAFLLELPPAATPPALVERLFEFRLAGLLPVLAHVERYLGLVQDLSRVEALGTKAALLVNLPALGGVGGWRIRRTARRLAREGLIHGASTDAHGPEDARACGAGIEWIARHLGTHEVKRLLIENPRRIVNGEIP